MINLKLKRLINNYYTYNLKFVCYFSKYIFFFSNNFNFSQIYIYKKAVQFNCNFILLKNKYLDFIFDKFLFIKSSFLILSDNFIDILNFGRFLIEFDCYYKIFCFNKFFVNFFSVNLNELIIWYNYYNYNYNYICFFFRIFFSYFIDFVSFHCIKIMLLVGSYKKHLN